MHRWGRKEPNYFDFLESPLKIQAPFPLSLISFNIMIYNQTLEENVPIYRTVFRSPAYATISEDYFENIPIYIERFFGLLLIQ